MNNRLLYMCIPRQRIGFVQSMDLFGSGHLLILSSNENSFSCTASSLVHYKQNIYLKISLQPTEKARAESLATQTSNYGINSLNLQKIMKPAQSSSPYSKSVHWEGHSWANQPKILPQTTLTNKLTLKQTHTQLFGHVDQQMTY